MDADVVIVGGGPAGCSAALTLAKFGFTSAIISAPKTAIKATETALPALSAFLRSIHAESALDACEPCYGIHSLWGRPESVLRPSIIDPHGHAWFIHRQRFDKALRQIAIKAGALWFESAAESVNFNDSGVDVITNEIHVEAKWLIIANGSPAWAARITRQGITKHDSLTALWGKLPDVKTERFLFVEPSEFGWWYLCPDDGPGSVACFVTDPPMARSLGVAQVANWNKLFQQTKLAMELAIDAGAERLGVASTGLMSLSKVIGPRWIAIGDAAAKLDPLGSGGTMTAMDGGRRAACAIINSMRGGNSELKNYEQWISCLVSEFSRQREQHYHLESMNRSSGFWNRRSFECATESQAH
jgi:flavin-dependent dehydrogenase